MLDYEEKDEKEKEIGEDLYKTLEAMEELYKALESIDEEIKKDLEEEETN